MEVEELLKTAIEAIIAYKGILIIAFIIKIIYFIALISKVGSVADDSWQAKKNQDEILILLEELNERSMVEIKLMNEQTEQLRKIAQALEQEEEPYIIEKEEG